MRRRTPVALALVAASTCLAAASLAAASQSVTAGSLASRTGSAWEYGVPQARGAALAAQQSRAAAGGVRVSLVNADDQSGNAMAQWQMTGLVGTRVSAVLGPTLSGAAAAADPIAVASGIPVLAVTNTTLDIAAAGPTVWRICLGEDQMIPASVAYAHHQQGLHTAALVSVTGDAYSEGAAAQFRSAAAAEGITLVADITIPMGSPGAQAAIDAAVASSPSALFMAARGSDALNLLTASAGFAGARVGGNGFNSSDVIGAAGAAGEGLIVSGSWNAGKSDAASTAFKRAYRSKYGSTPNAFAAQGYAGVQVLQAAVVAGHGTSATAVQRGLGRITKVATVLGTVTFPGSSHEATYPAVVQQVRGGVLVLAPKAGA